VYMDEKVSVIFNHNCFPKNQRRFKVRSPTGSHVHHKTGSMKKMTQVFVVMILQSHLFKWIALGPDFEYPLR